MSPQRGVRILLLTTLVIILISPQVLEAKSKERTIINAPEEVFAAALRTARERHLVTYVDEKELMLTFESGASALSYGFKANASVEPEGESRATLIIIVGERPPEMRNIAAVDPPQTGGGGCVDLNSATCRTQAAAAAQQAFRPSFPSISVKAVSDTIVFTDPTFAVPKDRMAARNTLQGNDALTSQLCRFGFAKVRLQPQTNGVAGSQQEEYSLSCPSTGKPSPSTAQVNKGVLSSPSPPAHASGPGAVHPSTDSNTHSSATHVKSASLGHDANNSETLASIKKSYLNQRVVIGGYVGSLGGPRLLLHWEQMKRVGDSYIQTGTFDYLPESYLGKSGTVVAIQLVHAHGQKTNALGEVVSEDETINPYFEVIVQLDDGILARTTAYPNTISLDLELAVDYEAFRRDIEEALPRLIGRNIYAVGYSRLYQPDSTLEEITGQQEVFKRISLQDIPFLEPIRILDAKYIGDDVVLKLRLPNGKLALSYTTGNQLRESTVDSNSSSDTLLKRMCGLLLLDLPTLTPREVDAVKRGTIFKGMSREAVYFVLGFPKKENDWGAGGKQLVFTDKFLVYLDRRDNVVDWQSLD